MKKNSNKTLFFFSGLFAIFLVYSLYKIYWVDISYYSSIPRKIRHTARFGSVLLVYSIGSFALKKYTVEWMMTIWHLLHIIIISLLVLIGLYDWTFGMTSVSVRNIAASFHEFLISPALYVAMGIIHSRWIKATD